jgi:hypothetical protein
MPRYLSSDNDPLYRFHQWQANLRILEVIILIRFQDETNYVTMAAWQDLVVRI